MSNSKTLVTPNQCIIHAGKGGVGGLDGQDQLQQWAQVISDTVAACARTFCISQNTSGAQVGDIFPICRGSGAWLGDLCV